MARFDHLLRSALGVAALAAVSTVAGAQTRHDSSAASRPHAAGAAARHDSSPARHPRADRSGRRWRSESRGEVVGRGVRATPRDYYGADDPRCDDLCQRERMMDRKYGRDRERLRIP